MGLKTFVKISNISNLSDARYCAGMMVDVMGFNIDPTSDSFISESDFSEITEWVAGVSFAGEFHNADVDQIRDIIKNYRVDYIEISNLDIVEKIGLLNKPLIVRLTIDSEAKLNELKSTLSYLDELAKMVIIKSDNPEIYNQLDAQIGYYNGNLKLLKGYSVLTNENLGKFPGIELEATEEERPGFKDYGQIMDVLESLEED
ncbi:beta/alpha barrel domain-containing protein [Ekhidna sp.]